MSISLLRIENFRNLSGIEFQPVQGLNIISGQNGSGKTSILEAIYYLGHNRSFRAADSLRMIKHSKEKFALFTQLLSENDIVLPVGAERHHTGESKFRIASKEVNRISKISEILPIRVINSQSHSIFESGPNFRRKYLDWGLFFQNQGFLKAWRQYERILKQRNSALKARCSKNELDGWTEELIKYGLIINEMRQQYIDQILPCIVGHVKELLDIDRLTMSYSPGWDDKLSFADALTESYRDELRLLSTQSGPHRADFDIAINGISAQHFLSRGQQKLLICAMILAQGTLLSKQANKTLIYLVDDLPSELDIESRNKLVTLLARQKTQVFITAIDSESICQPIRDLLLDIKINVFHVEHGNMCQEQSLGA